jgi:hypothetical protein
MWVKAATSMAQDSPKQAQWEFWIDRGSTFTDASFRGRCDLKRRGGPVAEVAAPF